MPYQQSFDSKKSLEELPAFVGRRIISMNLKVNEFPNVLCENMKCWMNGRLYAPNPTVVQLQDNTMNHIVMNDSGAILCLPTTITIGSSSYLILSTIECENRQVVFRRDTSKLQHFSSPYDCVISADNTGDALNLTKSVLDNCRNIYIRNGYYSIHGMLPIRAGTRLVGESREGVILDFQSDSKNKLVVQQQGCCYNGSKGPIEIDETTGIITGIGTTFKCAPSPAKRHDILVLPRDGRAIHIQRCITDTELQIAAGSSSSTTISADDWQIQPVQDNVYLSNLSFLDGIAPLQFRQAMNVELCNLAFRNCSDAIRLERSHHITLSRLQFQRCSNCIRLYESTCCTIRGDSQFRWCKDAAIRVLRCHDVSIRESRIKYSSKYGIAINDSKQVWVEQNQFDECDSCALLFQGSNRDCHILGNSVYGGKHGLSTKGTGQNCEISNNQLTRTRGMGIVVAWHHTVVRNNQILHPNDDGILLDSGVEFVMIVDNLIAYGSATGIRIQGTQSPTLVLDGNRFNALQDIDIVGQSVAQQ